MSTLVFDGDCGFCTTCANLIRRRLPTRARVVAGQETDLATLGLSAAQAQAALQWVADDGTVSSGAGAVGRLLVDCGRWWRPVGWALLTPPLSWLAAVVYRLVAANRQRLPGGTPACAVGGPGATGRPDAGPPRLPE